MKPRITTPEAWGRWGWMVSSVARRHGVLQNALLGRQRDRESTRARHDLMVCMWGSGLAYAEIGRLLGLDHTSVRYAVRRQFA